MISRLLTRPLSIEHSFFLFGPRGTGKTTWLKTHYPDALYIDLLDSSLYHDLLANPGRLERLIPPDTAQPVIIDEIQRLPALLNEVHRLIEERKLTFIMTGSSARTLRRRGVNLLAGRAYTFHLYPLTAAELGSSFSLSFSLQHGHLPSLYSAAENPELFLDSYIETYLREEVLQEGVTRNLGSFSRFLEAAAFSQGSVLNISDVARESGIERRTVSNYFDILEDLLLAFRLPVFTRRAKRRLISHSKFYYFDAGVFRAIRPAGPLDRPQEIEGQALETLCIQELKAVNEYYGMGYSLHFWRTSHGVEVDCVLYGERGLIAIEVKHSSRIHARSIRGLRLFLSDYPEARAYLFYMGKREEYWKGIHVIPVDKALRSLPGLLSGSQPHGAEDSQGSKEPQEI